MALFVICGVLGLILTLVSLFAGHDGDISADHEVGGDHGSETASIFSFRSITVFLTGFGAAGGIATHYGMSMMVSSIIGVLVGVFFAGIAWKLMTMVMSQQASSTINLDTLVNQSGVVTTSISENGMGEVMVEISGQRKYVHARSNSNTPIPEHTSVKILEVSAGVLVVQKVQ